MSSFNKILDAVKNKDNASMLFYGSNGVGKRYNAVLLAKHVLCMEPGMDGLPCNTCDNCARIDKNIHPNLIIIEPENKDIKIEVIRNVIQDLTFAPVENGKRFVIIDEAHRMNSSSANALLKTLEEPPRNTCFLLLSSNIKRLPATIISRCELFRFPPLTKDKIASILNISVDHDLLPYALGSVSRMSFYLSCSDEILSFIKFIKEPCPSYKKITAIVAGLLEVASSSAETFEYIYSLLVHLVSEHIEQRAVQGLDYSGILECVERLKSMNAAYYLNSQPSIVLENMLLDASNSLVNG